MTRITALTLPMVLIAALAMGADWPQWRGPSRDSISPETGWLDQWPPTPVWTQFVGVGFSGMSVSEGRLYTIGIAGVMHCRSSR